MARQNRLDLLRTATQTALDAVRDNATVSELQLRLYHKDKLSDDQIVDALTLQILQDARDNYESEDTDPD